MIPVNDGKNNEWHSIVHNTTKEDVERRIVDLEKDFQHVKALESFQRSKTLSGEIKPLYNLYVSDEKLDSYMELRASLLRSGWIYSGLVKNSDMVGKESSIEEKYGPSATMPMLGPGTPVESDEWTEVYLKEEVSSLWSKIKSMPMA